MGFLIPGPGKFMRRETPGCSGYCHALDSTIQMLKKEWVLDNQTRVFVDAPENIWFDMSAFQILGSQNRIDLALQNLKSFELQITTSKEKMECLSCTFQNPVDALVCEVCEMSLDSCFEQRWRDAKILVIGACYNSDDSKFWSELDPNYIGIGSGEHIFKTEPHWQTNWDNPGFWQHARPYRSTGFKYVFLDRCVWNIAMRNFQPVLDFILSVLQENGCFLIPKTNWKPAQDMYLKHQFISHAKPQFNRHTENEYDVEAVQTLVRSGNFMIVNSYSSFHSPETPNAMDRQKWKGFMKMKNLRNFQTP